MASGRADYFRGVDIAYQALSQVTVRPMYGASRLKAGSLQVTPDNYSLFFTISGKGVIYGGLVWLEYGFTQANDQVVLEVDGMTITGLSHFRLSKYGVTKPGAYPVFVNKFDAVNHIYSVSISPGITFESQIRLYYLETYSRDPTVFYRLMYSLL